MVVNAPLPSMAAHNYFHDHYINHIHTPYVPVEYKGGNSKCLLW